MLHQLVAYAEAQELNSEPGFRARKVRWTIVVSNDGGFQGVIPLGGDLGGEILSRCPEMHSMNSGGRAHFLIETAQTAVLLFKDNESEDKKRAAKLKHKFFIDMLKKCGLLVPQLNILGGFLDDQSRLDEVCAKLSELRAKPSDWVDWRINDFVPRVDVDVQTWWRDWRLSNRADVPQLDEGNGAVGVSMVCLLTGRSVNPLSIHPKIVGLSSVGGLPTGDVVVGFDKAAFGSYGLDKSFNAAMGEESVQKYVDGLNHLIRTRNQNLKLGNTLVVYWYKDTVAATDDPLMFLMGMETPHEAETVASASARRLLNAIGSGQRADIGGNRYYALSISGASGRVMVRDWTESRFDELQNNILAWFNDLSIVARDGIGNARDPKFMAVCGALVRDLKDITALTTAGLWSAAVHGLPIPRPVLAQALARFRVDLLDSEQPPFNQARMGLIKSYFVRLNAGGYPNMTATYNINHPASAYHCGGLLAVLANLQNAALGDVGAGVVQRYYPAASQTPGLVIGRLISNARNHLAKLDPQHSRWFEGRISEIMCRLGDEPPRILDLEGQGLFALGYYQKLAELRAGNQSNITIDRGAQS